MSTSARIPDRINTQHYEAVLRISEAISACREPQELATVIADQLSEFLHFDYLDIVIFKENSKDIECHAWNKGPLPFPDVSAEELATWHVFDTQQPLRVADWNSDERLPQLKQLAVAQSVKVGSLIRAPLTTPQRQLGVLGVMRAPGIAYTPEDVSFLCLIARGISFAIDNVFNLRRAQNAQACMQRQNNRLQLLLNLTKQITSNLELRELLRAIATNIREVMQCDMVTVSLADAAPGKNRLFAIDFPHAKGVVREEEVFTRRRLGERVLETLRPVVVNTLDPADFPPEISERMVAEGLKSICLIPLVNRGRALGILAIARTTETPFTADDVEFLSQAAGQIAIAVENAVTFKEVSELRDKLAQEKLYLEEEIRSEMGFEQIIGNSTGLKHVLELVNTVAPSNSTVLLLGETGTGKELIARAVHEHSRRKDRTFVKLNCAAIPTGLLESELFGHEKGAFTGAISQKIGRLELADQGTLFLDEVGDIPAEIQPKLLRALQEREFERLGSTQTRKVNVRLVAATNRDLEKMVAAREFRSDLYYRLNVFPIRIPPLRERREDIPLLVSYFVQKFAKQMQKKIEAIPVAVMKGLTAWEWPGNIRELENFIERAVLLTRGKSLEAPLAELRKLETNEPAPANLQAGQQDIARIVRETITALKSNTKKDVNKDIVDEYTKKQREEIVRALTESKGRVAGADGAAARVGLNRTTFLSRMKRFGINPKQYA